MKRITCACARWIGLLLIASLSLAGCVTASPAAPQPSSPAASETPSSVPSNTAAPSETPIPTSTIAPSPSALPEIIPQAPDARTEIETVDAVIDAILSADVESSIEWVHFSTLGCTTASGLGGPPPCREGEPDGSLVDAFPTVGSEGSHLRVDQIANLFPLDVQGLYAVYLTPQEAQRDLNFPIGEYGVIFIGSEVVPSITVYVDEQGMVRIDFHLGQNAAQALSASGGEVILNPPK